MCSYCIFVEQKTFLAKHKWLSHFFYFIETLVSFWENEFLQYLGVIKHLQTMYKAIFVNIHFIRALQFSEKVVKLEIISHFSHIFMFISYYFQECKSLISNRFLSNIFYDILSSVLVMHWHVKLKDDNYYLHLIVHEFYNNKVQIFHVPTISFRYFILDSAINSF